MAAPSSSINPPVSYIRLKQIANDACETAIGSAESYEHSKTESWNTTIINTILKSLISESSTSGTPPSYKYAVNSTIIQHLTPPTTTPRQPLSGISNNSSTTVGADEASTRDETHPVAGGAGDDRYSGSVGAGSGSTAHVGRRGMHSATGAYWNNQTDGMWSFKYEAIEGKGLDVVISVIWISIA
ncbi:MAG: hypothetical protein M1827_005365 [Pycnora praestabilis]|nr:MAG: hypothetical protein M1827_005365 [Pycnora praestabilis]